MKLLNAQFLGFNIESWDPIIVAVIITLAILAVISLIKGFINRSGNTGASVNQSPATQAISDNENDEIVAVISAAIAAFSEQDGNNYTIKSITPVRGKKAQANQGTRNSIWKQAGMLENTSVF